MELNNLEVKLDEPYPSLENVKEDGFTVGILKNLLASKNGELKAVLQYMFQSVVSFKFDAGISELLEEIGVVEMMHQEMLMQAILEFGGTPNYEDATKTPFNTSFVNYNTKLHAILENAVIEETFAFDSYMVASEKVKNESLKNLLVRIAKDEEHHAKILKHVLNSVEFLSL